MLIDESLPHELVDVESYRKSHCRTPRRLQGLMQEEIAHHPLELIQGVLAWDVGLRMSKSGALS